MEATVAFHPSPVNDNFRYDDPFFLKIVDDLFFLKLRRRSLRLSLRQSLSFSPVSLSASLSLAVCLFSPLSPPLSLELEQTQVRPYNQSGFSLELYERGYKWLPSEEEWERGVKICDLLKPFNTISTYFSGVKYPTANVYFIQVWKIEVMLKKYVDCEDDGDVRTMARAMQKKFAKYWNQYSVILAMGAALNPRLKLDILRSAYQKIDPRTSEEKDLFELENSLKSSSRNAKSNLETYLDLEPRLEMKTFEDMELSQLSVLRPFRNRILPKNVQALIATRNWLRGFEEFEGNIEDYFDDEDDESVKNEFAICCVHVLVQDEDVGLSFCDKEVIESMTN
uniref:hAT-like transposase RNase-H fold domain-containing protein n=1 Tax=Brassica oleracea var. oleracea TaxID=109376 RepID=A0A0D3BIH8_BRAOL